MQVVKIKDLQQGNTTVIPLVVLDVNKRETKRQVPYLDMRLYDGQEDINAKWWDYKGEKLPPKDAVLDVTAKVDVYLGAKQLNVQAMKLSQVDISAFMPSSGQDVSTIYKNAYALMSDVKNDGLRSVALYMLEEYMDKWLRIPAAKLVHHAYSAGTLIHGYSVAKLAKAIALEMKEACVDLATVGGMCHDIGKLFCYSISGTCIEMTAEAMLYDHVTIGNSMLDEYNAKYPEHGAACGMLKHIICSHHGTRDFGAIVTPCFMEAYIVHYADQLDSAYEQLVRYSGKTLTNGWTDKIWALDNKPHMAIDTVRKVLCCE